MSKQQANSKRLRLFDILRLLNPEIAADRTKIHLATSDGQEHPLDVYLDGKFNHWQQQQSQLNFERDLVLSLIALPERDRWLFAGLYHRKGVIEGTQCRWSYELDEDEICSSMNGRLVVKFSRSGRQSYLVGERWADLLVLDSIHPERVAIGEFPGFKAVHLSKSKLDLIVHQSPASWRTALSSVAGVYLISDEVSGRLYVGSACGEGGLWQRWSEYASSGHGGNMLIRQLLEGYDPVDTPQFWFSILEIADTHTSEKDILQRESHWKRVLCARSHGLNAN